MPVPFGVGVGDLIAVGKLIGSTITELQAVLAFIHLHMQLSGTNGQIEWTSESAYYSLLLELEALPRALLQSQDLKPAKHELLQLNAFRVTAFACSARSRSFSLIFPSLKIGWGHSMLGITEEPTSTG